MTVKLSYVILIALFLMVIANSIYIKSTTDKLSEMLESINTSELSDFREGFFLVEKFYKKSSNFISLTVSHDDLTSIEDAIEEIKGALSVADTSSAIIAKSRLENAIRHLGRLSTINLKSIF